MRNFFIPYLTHSPLHIVHCGSLLTAGTTSNISNAADQIYIKKCENDVPLHRVLILKKKWRIEHSGGASSFSHPLGSIYLVHTKYFNCTDWPKVGCHNIMSKYGDTWGIGHHVCLQVKMLLLTSGGMCPLCICPVVICCWAEGILPTLKVSGPPIDPDRIIPGSATEPCSTRPTRLNCCCKIVDLKEEKKR